MRTNKLILKYIKLSNLKENILKSVKNYSSEQINFKPTENQWSIAQVINHLIDSESGINKYINNKLKTIDEQPKVGIKNFIFTKALNNRLKTNNKYKSPSSLPEPEQNLSHQELKEKWDRSRLYLIDTVEKFPKGKMNTAIFKHPKVGLMSMNQTLSFMINHAKHHIAQIENLRNLIENQNKKRA